MTKQTFKRWAICTAVTFLGGFLVVFHAQIDTITMDSFKDGSLVGLVFVATRQGLKLAMELLITLFNNRK